MKIWGFFLVLFSFCVNSQERIVLKKVNESKIHELIIKKQKPEALKYIDQNLPTIKSSEVKYIQKMKSLILDSFLSEKTQTNYELAIYFMNKDYKKAKVLVKEGLEEDALNIPYLWLELKLLKINKDSSFDEKARLFLILTAGLDKYSIHKQQLIEAINNGDKDLYLSAFKKNKNVFYKNHPDFYKTKDNTNKKDIENKCKDITVDVYKEYIDDLNFCLRS